MFPQDLDRYLGRELTRTQKIEQMLAHTQAELDEAKFQLALSRSVDALAFPFSEERTAIAMVNLGDLVLECYATDDKDYLYLVAIPPVTETHDVSAIASWMPTLLQRYNYESNRAAILRDMAEYVDMHP